MPYTMTSEDEQMCAQALRETAGAEEDCRRLRACGLDTSAPDAYCQALRQRLEAFRQQFSMRGKD